MMARSLAARPISDAEPVDLPKTRERRAFRCLSDLLPIARLVASIRERAAIAVATTYLEDCLQSKGLASIGLWTMAALTLRIFFKSSRYALVSGSSRVSCST